MDSRQRALAELAAIISALAEGPSPASLIYIALGMDLERWQRMQNTLILSGLATVQGHLVTLTAKGQEVAKQLNAVAGI